MIFIPTDSQGTADAITEALWNLSRPSQVRAEDEVTERLFDTRTDADGTVWLCVIPTLKISIHKDAVFEGVSDILLGAGVSQEDIDGLESLVVSRRGGTMVPWEYFPQVLKDSAKEEGGIIWPNKTSNI